MRLLIALLLLLSPFTAQSEERLREDHVACSNEGYLSSIVRLSARKEYEQAQRATAIGISTGICRIIRAGTPYELVRSSFEKRLIKVDQKRWWVL